MPDRKMFTDSGVPLPAGPGPTPRGLIVSAALDNFHKPRRSRFDLIREKGRWRINDVSSLRKGGRLTLSDPAAQRATGDVFAMGIASRRKPQCRSDRRPG